VLFVTTVLISRSASNPVRNSKQWGGQVINGGVGSLCQGTSGACNGPQNGQSGQAGQDHHTINGGVGSLCQGGAPGSCTGAQNGQHNNGKKKRSIPKA